MVEDEVLIRMEICDFLESCDVTAVPAADGDEAIDVLGSGRRIDLVLTDLQMPGERDGIDVALWVQENRGEIPVIVTTGNAELARRAQEVCEKIAYLPKPLAYGELRSHLDRLSRGGPE